jgi:hypothetical protein
MALAEEAMTIMMMAVVKGEAAMKPVTTLILIPRA